MQNTGDHFINVMEHEEACNIKTQINRWGTTCKSSNLQESEITWINNGYSQRSARKNVFPRLEVKK